MALLLMRLVCAKLLKVDEGPLGFTSCGIVASIATPLSALKLPLFYTSTFITDYVLVSIFSCIQLRVPAHMKAFRFEKQTCLLQYSGYNKILKSKSDCNKQFSKQKFKICL